MLIYSHYVTLQKSVHYKLACMHTRNVLSFMCIPSITWLSHFRIYRCWWCYCYPPAHIEESKEVGSTVHELRANPLVCHIMWQATWGGYSGSRTLHGRLLYSSHIYIFHLLSLLCMKCLWASLVTACRLWDITAPEKGNGGKRSSNRTWTFVSYALLQSFSMSRSFVPNHPLCAGHRCAADCNCLRPAPSRLTLVPLMVVVDTVGD